MVELGCLKRVVVLKVRESKGKIRKNQEKSGKICACLDKHGEDPCWSPADGKKYLMVL
jgi:hypothetical protein